MKAFKISLVNAVLAALALCTMARAGAPKEFPPTKIEATQTDALKQGPAGRTYTPETLRALLDNMGYEYKTLPDKGGDYYVVTVNHDGWTFYIQVDCSTDGSVIWFGANVGSFPDADQDPAALLTLLEKNAKECGKAMFRKGGKQIILSQPVDNHDLTPAQFRKELEVFCTTVKAMKPYYEAAEKSAAVAKGPAKGAEGKQESK